MCADVGIPAALGVSLMGGRDVNILALARKVNEESENVLVRLVERNSSKSKTVSLTSEEVKKRQIQNSRANETSGGVSMHPRATATMILKLDSYGRLLNEVQGILPEYTDFSAVPVHKNDSADDLAETKSLHCRLEDFTQITSEKELKEDSNPYVVGYTVMERFLCFSSVTNDTVSGLEYLKKTGFAETPSSSESELYDSNRRILALCGCNIKTADLRTESFDGIPIPLGAKVIFCPSFWIDHSRNP